jgi:hypothetical protein
MTLASDLIERTKRHLYTETRDDRNRLTTTIDTDDTTLAFDFDLNGIQAGAVISIDLEEMFVWSVGSGTAVVQRAQGGSTAAAHTAGATVYVNPKYSAFSVLQALNEDLLDLSSPVNGLYRVATVELDFVAGQDAYNLTGVTDLQDILSVSYDANDGSDRWNVLDRGGWRLARSQPTDVFSTGLSFTVNGYAQPGRPINVAYKTSFTAALTTLADNVLTVTGLPVSMHDIPPLGAAVRLLAGSEVARNFLDQGETRRSDEVPPGARGASVSGLMRLRRDRIAAEAARLYSQWPVAL